MEWPGQAVLGFREVKNVCLEKNEREKNVWNIIWGTAGIVERNYRGIDCEEL